MSSFNLARKIIVDMNFSYLCANYFLILGQYGIVELTLVKEADAYVRVEAEHEHVGRRE